LSRVDTRRTVHVVAAAVIDAANRVLIAQRPPGKHLAGGWEFPGGKLEPGEERRAGLARELNEELGIRIGSPRPLIRVRHAYPTRDILLDMWVATSYSGEPRGLDGQALRWCTQDELSSADLLPADKPIVKALRLPERLTVASSPHWIVRRAAAIARESANAGTFEHRLQGVLCEGYADAVTAAVADADFLVMKNAASHAELTKLGDAVSMPVFARGIELLQAWDCGISGVNEISDELLSRV